MSDTLPPLDEAAWDLWVEYRRQLKHPLPPISHPIAKRKLQRFGAQQMAVVEQSVENGWRGLFPVRDTAVLNPDFNPQAPW